MRYSELLFLHDYVCEEDVIDEGGIYREWKSDISKYSIVRINNHIYLKYGGFSLCSKYYNEDCSDWNDLISSSTD